MELTVKTSTGVEYVSEGERAAVPLVAVRGRYEVDDRRSRGLHKTAACDDAVKAASKVEPHPDKVAALVIGLGSEEFWGVNNNGDSFPEPALLGKPPKGVKMGFFDKYAHRMPKSWGFETFKKAHVFEEHRNTSPKLAMGGIIDTFWNAGMHRVENLVFVNRRDRRGAKWAKRIDENDPTVGTSMACHVPFDRCSICGNLAPTRGQYCSHLRQGSPEYALRSIRPDGKPVSMINDFPDFFDESFVEVPAAPEALLIAKVASAKGATIEKREPDPAAAGSAYDDLASLYHAERALPDVIVDKLAALGLPAATKAASDLGVCFRPSELLRMAFGPDAIDKIAAAALDQVALQVKPDTFDGDAAIKLAASTREGALAKASEVKVATAVSLLMPFVAGRSYAEPYLTPRLMRLAKVAHQRVWPTPEQAHLLRAYHTLCKQASGFCGYGERQALATFVAMTGDH